MLAYPPHPDEPITAVCAATYYADLIPAFAFIFRVENTGTRFTVYATEQHRWLINSTYTLTIAEHNSEPGRVPLRLSTDEAGFLHHCLGLLAQRWQDAITEAEAGAQHPATDEPASPGHLNIEPTPAGYQAIAGRFRDELHRVQDLLRRLDQLQPTTPDTGTQTATDADAGAS
ncbi:hypothetical protein [Phytohabitans houttuyneae]|uniref:Uncharacterized protein n=1 Tax=Phytohabitans houttuyneae TaxID=1076126 RepID=A0A6V8KWJ7_9ACTN|nr:hypothetical protein [Phytohabitans houttuyneae]GFJ84965.1 hypothetical protein Phou_091450 [Phytohabitans houttuyneae]